MHQTTTKGAPGHNVAGAGAYQARRPQSSGKFEFAFMAPNQWAGAGIEIKGQADADGKTQADDVSGYKKITLQLYAKGAEMIRVEAMSRGHGTRPARAIPQMSFKVRPGLNTYEVALEGAALSRAGST